MIIKCTYCKENKERYYFDYAFGDRKTNQKSVYINLCEDCSIKLGFSGAEQK